MTETTKNLALALFAYEMDSPHTGEFAEGDQHYPEISWAEFEAMLTSEHQGDCVGLPAPCPRCFCEAVMHKAEYLADVVDAVGFP